MKLLITFFFFSFFFTSIFAIEPNQWDNFQDGTTYGWGHGQPNPYQPVVVNDGGPAGSGDAYLKVSSSGTSGAGSMLITFNIDQWTGDYITSGVNMISMHMANYTNESLSMRICVEGAGGSFWSITPVMLPPQSGWQVARFSLLTSDMTGGTNLNATLSSVTKLRILHSVAGGSSGDLIAAELGLDNITAAPDPLPVELVSFTALQSGTNIILNWVTASEINNFGFEIERKLFLNGSESKWTLIGFKNGFGTSSEQNIYSFTDNLANVNADRAGYRLKQIDFNGSFTYSNAVYAENIIPSKFKLFQNYPNPFNPATKIKFSIPRDEFVSLKIFNSVGNEIADLISERRNAGIYKIEFEASGFPSGVYFYKLSAGNFSETKKLILIK